MSLELCILKIANIHEFHWRVLIIVLTPCLLSHHFQDLFSCSKSLSKFAQLHFLNEQKIL